jgi:hypothetical protein
MRSILALVVLVFSSGCTATDPGSLCAKDPVEIFDARSVRVPSEVPAPLVVSSSFAALITLDKGSVERILRERQAASPIAAPRLLSLLGAIDASDAPKNLESFQPVLDGLSGSELQENIQLTNEIQVLVLEALKDGEASVSVRGRKARQVEMQRYTGDDPYGQIRGVRFLVDAERVYDYCGVWPR